MTDPTASPEIEVTVFLAPDGKARKVTIVGGTEEAKARFLANEAARIFGRPIPFPSPPAPPGGWNRVEAFEGDADELLRLGVIKRAPEEPDAG